MSTPEGDKAENAPEAGLLARVLLDDVSVNGAKDFGHDFPIHIAGIQNHVIPGGIHHGQYAQGGLGVNAELVRPQEDFVGVLLANEAELFRSFHRIDVNVNVHDIHSSWPGLGPQHFAGFIPAARRLADLREIV